MELASETEFSKRNLMVSKMRIVFVAVEIHDVFNLLVFTGLRVLRMPRYVQ